MDADLRRLLDDLDAAIDRSKAGDEDRDELLRLVRQVEERLEAEDDEHHDLLDPLEERAARFDAEHPTLSQAIRRLVDVLSASGI